MSEDETYDYIVVGGGAAGCVVASRLALAGLSVCVLEAGGDPLEPGAEPPPESKLPPRPAADDYSVPAFHTFSTENPSMKWDFWVRHYADDAQQRKDPNITNGMKRNGSTAYSIRDRAGSAAARDTMR